MRYVEVDRPFPGQAVRIDHGVLPMVEAMMQNGVRLDVGRLEALGKQIDRDMAEKYGEIEASIDPLPMVNPGSPPAVGNLLFGDLGVQGDAEVPRTAKTKQWSTEERYLKMFQDNHEVIPLILDWRELAKLKGTYVVGLLKAADPAGMIHTTFSVTRARTGRLASEDPNLQNIPVRTDLGREIRRCFIPRTADYVLTTVDQSQIELRVTAHLSHDPVMVDAYLNAKDLHTITASAVFNVPFNLVTPTQRSRAKTINFGIVYGLTPKGLQNRIAEEGGGIWEIEKCRAFIAKFFDLYRGVRVYMDQQFTRAKRYDAVWTMFGRVRWIPQARNPVERIRESALRQAGNTPIQGGAGDILKISMADAWPHIEAWGDNWLPVLQVHDEVVSEVRKERAEEQVELLSEIMRNAVELSVPVEASGGVADNWGDLK